MLRFLTHKNQQPKTSDCDRARYSNSRVPTPITTKQAAALLADIEQFQDCAMILAQQIEQHLEPIAGQDSPHFTAWRLSQMLRERLEDGWLQNNARQMLGVA